MISSFLPNKPQCKEQIILLAIGTAMPTTRYSIPPAATFGGAIRQIRKSQKRTLQNVVDSIGNQIGVKYLSKIERSSKVPGEKVIRLLAKALQVDEEHLLYFAFVCGAPEEKRHQLMSQAIESGDVPTWYPKLQEIERFLRQMPDDSAHRFLDAVESLAQGLLGSTQTRKKRALPATVKRGREVTGL